MPIMNIFSELKARVRASPGPSSMARATLQATSAVMGANNNSSSSSNMLATKPGLPVAAPPTRPMIDDLIMSKDVLPMRNQNSPPTDRLRNNNNSINSSTSSSINNIIRQQKTATTDTRARSHQPQSTIAPANAGPDGQRPPHGAREQVEALADTQGPLFERTKGVTGESIIAGGGDATNEQQLEPLRMVDNIDRRDNYRQHLSRSRRSITPLDVTDLNLEHNTGSQSDGGGRGDDAAQTTAAGAAEAAPTVDTESGSVERQQQSMVRRQQFSLKYPDYCWFDGLENRILMEYPQLRTLVEEHDQARAALEVDKAIELHKQLYKQIYLQELERASAEEWPGVANGNRQQQQADHLFKAASSQDRAAYAVFNLWANTPGDFSVKQTEFGNYLEPYFVHSHIEFWSYYYDGALNGGQQSEAAKEVLEQITILAQANELGPLELLQVSMNIIMLMNSYKADLTLDKLIGRDLVKETQYDEYFRKLVRLIERDEDFNDVTFDYVFLTCASNNNCAMVHQMIDPHIERFILRSLIEAP